MRDFLPVRYAMPPLDDAAPALSFFEFWPPWLFYLPMWLWIGVLAIRHRGLRLPLLANPRLPAGGLVGESKREIFAQLRGEERDTLAPYVALYRQGTAAIQLVEAEIGMARAGFGYPIVAKPDIGCRGAGVQPVRNATELLAYLTQFPKREVLILQEMVQAQGEAGVFYVREPGERRGQIFSLTLKYFPLIIGDGTSTIEDLIRRDPRAGKIARIYLTRFAERLCEVPAMGEAIRLVFAGNHCRGAIFRDGSAWITDLLRDRFDRIADCIPDFHFGRFDIRFTDFEAVRRGEGFTIVEFNGAGAEATHIWDSGMSLFGAWHTLARQYALLFEIGAANRTRGHRPERLWSIFRRWRREKQASLRYPPTA
jgi:hypothetical protein